MSARRKSCLILIGLFIVLGLSLHFAASPGIVRCQDKGENVCVDKELCALMLRAGKEAFERGKYIEARSFFKKAVQADVNSEKAWRWYNITLSYALAEQSKTIVYPDLGPSAAVPEQKEPEADVEFKMVGEDVESC